jgi:hypothetical protein
MFRRRISQAPASYHTVLEVFPLFPDATADFYRQVRTKFRAAAEFRRSPLSDA